MDNTDVRNQQSSSLTVLGAKVAKLNIEATGTGINLDVDEADEGIHIEYEILPDVIAAIVQQVLAAQARPGPSTTSCP